MSISSISKSVILFIFPSPIDFDIDEIILNIEGFFVWSTAKKYLFEFDANFFSMIFFIIKAKSFMWIVGREFFPSPIIFIFLPKNAFLK